MHVPPPPFDPHPPACPSCGQPGSQITIWDEPIDEFTCYTCGAYELYFDREEWLYIPLGVQRRTGMEQRGYMDGEQRPSVQLFGYRKMVGDVVYRVGTLAEALAA